MIGALTDAVMLPLFDGLRPFAVHNHAMQELKAALEDVNNVADPIQNKCRSLLFEGSGARHVFEEHSERLKDRAAELKERGESLPAHLVSQLQHCEGVMRALQAREDEVRLNRAFVLFNIDRVNFAANREKALVESEIKTIRARGKPIFDAVSTQAFQIGYLMAALAMAEMLLPDTGGSYQDRLHATKFASALLVDGLNSFFAVSSTKHRTLAGYVTEQRARAFDSAERGFRGLLAAGNVRELNEKQWEFFRYMVLEIVHSKGADAAVKRVLGQPQWHAWSDRYRQVLPELLADLDAIRKRYFDSTVRTALNAPEFIQQVQAMEMKARVEGRSESEVQLMKDKALDDRKFATLTACEDHLKASLKVLEARDTTIQRLRAPADTSPTAEAASTPSAASSSTGADLPQF